MSNENVKIVSEGLSIEATDFQQYLDMITSAVSEIDRITFPFQGAILSPQDTEPTPYTQSVLASKLLTIAKSCESLKNKLLNGIMSSKG